MRFSKFFFFHNVGEKNGKKAEKKKAGIHTSTWIPRAAPGVIQAWTLNCGVINYPGNVEHGSSREFQEKSTRNSRNYPGIPEVLQEFQEQRSPRVSGAGIIQEFLEQELFRNSWNKNHSGIPGAGMAQEFQEQSPEIPLGIPRKEIRDSFQEQVHEIHTGNDSKTSKTHPAPGKKKSWKIPFSTQLFPPGLRGSGGNKKGGIKRQLFLVIQLPTNSSRSFSGKSFPRGDE